MEICGSSTDDYESVKTGQVHPIEIIFFENPWSEMNEECALLLAQYKIKFTLRYHLTKAQTS